MLDEETKKAHINDTTETKTFLMTMVELSNQCRKEERTLYASEVHKVFATLNLKTHVRAGQAVGKPMSANAINSRVKKALEAIKDLALSAGNPVADVEREFNRLADDKKGIMKVKADLDIGDNQPMALFTELNGFLEFPSEG